MLHHLHVVSGDLMHCRKSRCRIMLGLFEILFFFFICRCPKWTKCHLQKGCVCVCLCCLVSSWSAAQKLEPAYPEVIPALLVGMLTDKGDIPLTWLQGVCTLNGESWAHVWPLHSPKKKRHLHSFTLASCVDAAETNVHLLMGCKGPSGNGSGWGVSALSGGVQ